MTTAAAGICENCGGPITKRYPNRPNRFCSRACYNAVGRPKHKADVANRMVRMPSHPLAPPSGIFAVARVVLYDKIGSDEQACHWCQKPIRWENGRGPDAIVVDHLDWNPANDAPDNLVPSCRICNAQRTRQAGGSKLITLGEPTVLRRGRPTRAVTLYCQVCGSEFLTAPAELNSGRGRTCSRSCARKLPRKPRS